MRYLGSKRSQTGVFIPTCSRRSRPDGGLPALLRVVKKLETSRGTFILVSPLMLKVLEVRRLPLMEDLVTDLTMGKPPPILHNLHPVAWRINSLQDHPGNTKDILKAGWRQSTEDRYDRAWQSSKRPLRSPNVPLDKVGVKHILNYIAHFHNLGLAYQTISLHSSTISMTLPYVNGVPVGSHPLVSRMCKGSFEKRPPPCKVPSVWDPTPVLDLFMHWHLPLSYAHSPSS
jgi:hypothetical protein